MKEVDLVNVEPLEGSLQILAQLIAVDPVGFRGDVNLVARELLDGCADYVLGLILTVSGGRVEVVDSLAVGVDHQLGVGVDVLGLGELHSAEADHRDFLTRLTVWLVEH